MKPFLSLQASEKAGSGLDSGPWDIVSQFLFLQVLFTSKENM